MQIFKTVQVPARASIGLLILRLLAGIALITHGYEKIQNPFAWMGPEATTPAFFQLMAAIAEFGGAIAWIFGLLTPLFSLLVACTMATAIYHHLFIFGGSFEMALLYFAIAALLFFVGPGRFSVDKKLFG
jgi:putative oxidoreductase